jgi:hypothetical protein
MNGVFWFPADLITSQAQDVEVGQKKLIYDVWIIIFKKDNL